MEGLPKKDGFHFVEYVFDKETYDIEKFKKALQKYDEDTVKNNVAFGCLSNSEPKDYINVLDISHIIQEINIMDDVALMKVCLLETPRGLDAWNEFQGYGMKLKLRGHSNDDGEIEIQQFVISIHDEAH